jgi:hypothetical protein
LLSFRSVAEESAFPTQALALTPKKIFQKVGMFLDHEKVTVSTPQSPCNSPQLHHDLPPQKHQKTQKTPAKPSFTTSKKIFPKFVH